MSQPPSKPSPHAVKRRNLINRLLKHGIPANGDASCKRCKIAKHPCIRADLISQKCLGCVRSSQKCQKGDDDVIRRQQLFNERQALLRKDQANRNKKMQMEETFRALEREAFVIGARLKEVSVALSMESTVVEAISTEEQESEDFDMLFGGSDILTKLVT